MNTIRNIYCVGRNYAEHAKELNNEVPTSPFLFSKPSHAIVFAQGKEIALPGDRGAVHYEVEWVVKMGRDYAKGLAVDELIDEMALGVDFTLRDVQTELKKKAHPWLLAKGFPNSGLLTPFHPFPGLQDCLRTDFSLRINGTEVQRGNIKDMIFNLEILLGFAAKHLGLGKGDILFTGTPAGVGPLSDKDHLELYWGNERWGSATVRLTGE